MDYCIIPGSKNIDYIKDNFNIFDFELTDEEMNKIVSLDKEKNILSLMMTLRNK